MTIQALTERVETLERENRRLRTWGVSCMVLVLGASMVGLASGEEIMRVKGVSVLDSEGKERAWLTSSGIRVASSDGKRHIAMQCLPRSTGTGETLRFEVTESVETRPEEWEEMPVMGMAYNVWSPAARSQSPASPGPEGKSRSDASAELWLRSRGVSPSQFEVRCEDFADLEVGAGSRSSIHAHVQPKLASLTVGPLLGKEEGRIHLETLQDEATAARVMLCGGPRGSAHKQPEPGASAVIEAARSVCPNTRAVLALAADGTPHSALLDPEGRELPEAPK